MVYSTPRRSTTARERYGEGLAQLEAASAGARRGRTFADVIDDLRWTNFLLAYQGEDDRRFAGAVRGDHGGPIDAVGPEWRAPVHAVGAGAASGSASHRRSFPTGPAVATSGAGSPDSIARASRSSSTTCAATSRHSCSICRRRSTACARFPARRWRRRRSRRDPRGRARRSRLSRARDGRADLRARRAAPRARSSARRGDIRSRRGTRRSTRSSRCAAMEPSDAVQHYSERLIRLPGIGTDYERPAVPDGASRARFGLPDGVPLFLCPQSLFKIHPDNDALFARVLAAVPAARLVVFEGRHPALTAKYRARLAARSRARAAWRRSADRSSAMRSRRLPAHQCRLRRDARHAALVGRQHEPRCARRGPADRDAARAFHARAAERRHAHDHRASTSSLRATRTTTCASRRRWLRIAPTGGRSHAVRAMQRRRSSTIRCPCARWRTRSQASCAANDKAARRVRARQARTTARSAVSRSRVKSAMSNNGCVERLARTFARSALAASGSRAIRRAISS